MVVASLQEQLGVALSGQHWELQDVTLWQSTDPTIILFASKQPVLMKNSDKGRYQATLNQTSKWQDDHYAITSGSLLFTITSSPDYDLQVFQRLKEQWRNVLLNKGYTGDPNPKFVPLPRRNGKTQSILGSPFEKVNTMSFQDDSSTTSNTSTSYSLMVDLTDQGAQALAKGLREKSSLPGSVKYTYEYPQMMPEVDAHITLHGLRVFTYLSRELNHSDDGTLYGSRSDLESAWNTMVQGGDVEIRLVGSLSPDMTARQQELVSTSASQALQQWFDMLFTPLPDTMNTQPDVNNGSTNYALRWHKRSEASDLSLVIKFDSWNWLEASTEIDFTTLFQPLDETYINVLYTEASVPVSLVVEAHPLVSNVAVSLTFSDGRAPAVSVFGKDGGTDHFVLTSSHPDQVSIQYNARVNFAPSQWPVMEVNGTATVAQGGNHISIKPGTWIHHHTLYLYERDGNQIKKANEVSANDYLMINATYRAPNATSLIKASAHLTTLTPMDFSYPVLPGDGPGEAKLSAFGVIGAQQVRSQELSMREGDDAVFILASKDGIQLVSKDAVIAEDDALAQRLRESGARPVILNGTNGKVMAETEQAGQEANASISVALDVELIPQPTPVSCWAAALTMVISARDKMSYTPDTVASTAGMDLNTGYGWSDIQHAVSAWNLRQTGPGSAMPSEWVRLLQAWGPLWIVEVGAPYHAVVLAGLEGDETPAGTQVTIYNPWPPNQGAIEYKTFLDFDNEFGLGAGAGAMILHA